jgi:hypothetical protein
MTKNLRRKVRRTLSDFQSLFLQDWIFIHINKTGGSSIEKALGMQFDHRSAREKIEAIGNSAWERKFTFSFVRNPWDKVVSQYHYRLNTGQAGFRDYPPDFNDWVRKTFAEKHPLYYDQPLMFADQMEWIGDFDGRILVDFIGRFENLQSDFDDVCHRIGRKSVILPHLKPSSHAHYRDYYTAQSRNIIADHFERDIRHLGYDF